MMHERPKGYSYTKASKIYISHFKNGVWDEGRLDANDQLTISGLSTSLHYGQECFEGLKAYRRKDGKIQLFRVEDNARRFQMSCSHMVMPLISVERFVEAVKRVVLANEAFIPPYGFKDTLYIRPFMIGVGDNLGLRAAPEYIFAIIVSPVGSYFNGEVKPVDLVVSEFDRAAPHGTGHVKVGGNYAASLLAQTKARKDGFADCIFLDPISHTKIEEVGAANFFGITKEKQYITPKSPSILDSITNRSLKYLAKHHLNLEVIEGDIFIDHLKHLEEAGACGTAAVITPIGTITHHGKKHIFPASNQMGEYTKKLYDLLTGIQFGDIEDPMGWVTVL
ncbi:MAG: branched chain amino acid aminotransferase [Tenericutes bacterium GWC2_34_14]|nr:MAG: branched chain amino acid aminotransferase [Tenericutes bacterium GWC2_34_14]OHE34521.1 MAG: branched chain amino acid aminotransferase [Tenericutes bacterium GWE2_34_108]OHE35878.1 MAG: branched chain amino acid aminotransferase [Tenericutes bacterium GWF1_35_14]OHE39036.1 MAG: branched chain amino acid aminotransferase [Tenericutes bacterium GWF2_35_184]OHE42897.1 MAG: branched chain amino acid aminotransferase [Tenericutes bacterium RIFOXYA2_FULL_36_32]OHE44443.1 MAG: branched chain